MAFLTFLAILTILSILTILTLTTETTISTDRLAIDYRAVLNGRSTFVIEVHRTTIAATSIAAGITRQTIETGRTRLSGQTSFAGLTGKTICHCFCHCIGIVGIRLFRPVGVVWRPMVRVTRVGYRGIRRRIKGIQWIQSVIRIGRWVKNKGTVLAVLTSCNAVFDN